MRALGAPGRPGTLSTLLALLALSHATPAAAAELPRTMRAAAIERAGDAAALAPRSLPVPAPGEDEVLIALETAGVASWDIHLRKHPESLRHGGFPLVLGTDGAGTIAAVGARVRGFTIGERVYAYSWDNPRGGFYAEYVAVPAERVGRVPKGLGLREAGAIPTTGLTALQGIDDALRLQRRERLVVVGAAGGVGTLAVQFAKLRGAQVLAVASGEDGLALVRRLGADDAVDGRRGDVVEALRRFAPEGVDAVLALAGGDALERCLDALRAGGRVAFPTGVTPEPTARPGAPPAIRYDAVAGPTQFVRLGAAIEAARLVVPVAAEFPLARAAEAHTRVEAGHVLGKVLLRIR